MSRRLRNGLIAVPLAYLVVVCAFEGLAVYFGAQQARDGVAAGEDWIVLRTQSDDGPRDTVVAGVEIAGHVYVAANHWPRAWYHRALANPDITVVRAGRAAAHHVVEVTGDELLRVRDAYALPLAVRVLTGFPPRAFLRLDPR